MLLGYLFFARELLKPSASLLDVGNSFMLHIGNLMQSMVISLVLKSKIIPNSFMVLVPIMRSNAAFPKISSYSTISGCMSTVLLLLYI